MSLDPIFSFYQTTEQVLLLIIITSGVSMAGNIIGVISYYSFNQLSDSGSHTIFSILLFINLFQLRGYYYIISTKGIRYYFYFIVLYLLNTRFRGVRPPDIFIFILKRCNLVHV